MDAVTPSLGYRDARAALTFLVDALGFEVDRVYDDASGDEIQHAMLRWPGGGAVSLHSAGGSSVAGLAERAAADGGYPAFGVDLPTEDPDQIYARAVAAGATVVREIEDSRLGYRSFIVSDPEGLYWSVGTRLPELVRDDNGAWRPA